MTKLGVNIDHIATLRQARRSSEPDPVHAAGICELAGADSIVVHLREDRRHINERDVKLLKETVKTKLNLEMSIARGIVDIALEVKPYQATLVPEKREEITTEGGLDVVSKSREVREVVKKLKENGIRVSLFINPYAAQIEASKEVGAEFVELHTGLYADSITDMEIQGRLQEIIKSTQLAIKSGLKVNAGHGLNYINVKEISRISGIEELNIGYSIISRAVLVGLDKAVREMLELVKS